MFNTITYARLNNQDELTLAGTSKVFSENMFSRKLRQRAKQLLENNNFDYVIYRMKIYDRFDDKFRILYCMIPLSKEDFILKFNSLKDIEYDYVCSLQSA